MLQWIGQIGVAASPPSQLNYHHCPLLLPPRLYTLLPEALIIIIVLLLYDYDDYYYCSNYSNYDDYDGYYDYIMFILLTTAFGQARQSTPNGGAKYNISKDAAKVATIDR